VKGSGHPSITPCLAAFLIALFLCCDGVVFADEQDGEQQNKPVKLTVKIVISTVLFLFSSTRAGSTRDSIWFPESRA
jgi:hypothetical protein